MKKVKMLIINILLNKLKNKDKLSDRQQMLLLKLYVARELDNLHK